jgi:predicted DNA-binding protein (UPF0251 family)
MERQELATLIHEAVARLPQILREAVSLFYFEGYSVDEAARFLDIPSGTLKRRLREAAERISQGEKPMNQEREQILQQLGDLIDKGGDSDAVYRVMREAIVMRPVPHDLLQTLMRRQVEAAQKTISPESLAERERLVREHWDEYTRPSKNALDPEHPVGAAAFWIPGPGCRMMSRWRVPSSTSNPGPRPKAGKTSASPSFRFRCPAVEGCCRRRRSR